MKIPLGRRRWCVPASRWKLRAGCPLLGGLRRPFRDAPLNKVRDELLKLRRLGSGAGGAGAQAWRGTCEKVV